MKLRNTFLSAALVFVPNADAAGKLASQSPLYKPAEIVSLLNDQKAKNELKVSTNQETDMAREAAARQRHD
jgi:hypothetical protein